MRAACAFGLILCTASCITASEWHGVGNTIVVDEKGGPGSQFTDIPDAVNAAAPGDLVLVRPGNYSPFLLNKALTILGAPNGASRVARPSTLPLTIVGGIPEGGIVAIADLAFPSSFGAWGTKGTVALDGCGIGRLITFNADDLRIDRAPQIGRAQMQGSHVEIVSSTVGGGVATAHRVGVGMEWAIGVLGELRNELIWPTIALSDQSKLVCAITSVHGRHVYIDVEGTNVLLFPFTEGTSACAVGGASELALVGTSADVVRGGDSTLQPGVSYSSSGLPLQIGWGGNAIDLESERASYSGVQLLGGAGGPITDPLLLLVLGVTTKDGHPVDGASASKLVPITPDNPTLELLDTPKPGSKVRLRVRGPVGWDVVVAYGKPTIVAVPSLRPIEALVAATKRLRPGKVPAAGELTFEADVPAEVETGAHVFLQAQLSPPSGAARASNSIVLVAR